jgi:hypothetical protein
MNGRKAKMLRTLTKRVCADKGIDVKKDWVNYSALNHQAALGVKQQIILQDNCGRGVYQHLKKSYKKGLQLS